MRVRVYGSGGGDGGGDGVAKGVALGVGHEIRDLLDELQRQLLDLSGLCHTHIFGTEQFHRRANPRRRHFEGLEESHQSRGEAPEPTPSLEKRWKQDAE